MRAAIAIVAIGEAYRRHHERVFMPSVRRYADAHGYDLLLFDRHLAPPELQHASTVSFTKLLIPLQDEVRKFDCLLLLDADILVNRQAPKFAEIELDGGIGVVDEWSQPSPDERAEYQRANGWEVTATEYFALAGFALQTRTVPNSGMFICDPARHRDFFAGIAERHLEAYLGHPRGFHFEQSAFGYELQQAGLARFLPAGWNRIWPLHRPPIGTAPTDRLRLFRHFLDIYRQSHFLHLAMGRDHDLAFLARNR